MDTKRSIKRANGIISLGSGGKIIQDDLIKYSSKLKEGMCILDVGSFFGSTTAYLSIGTTGKNIPIFCYDKWVIDKRYKNRLKKHLDIEFDLNTDILPIFKKNIKRFGGNIATHKGDFSEVKEWGGDKIGLVVYDPGCDVRMLNNLVETFSRYFIKKKTVLFLMDYYFYEGEKNKDVRFHVLRCFMNKNKKCFKFIERSGESKTAIFLYTSGKIKTITMKEVNCNG